MGGSAAGVVATAIVKDVYSGRKRGSVLAIVQSMVLISPAVAPILGAFLLKVTSWRGIFGSLTGIGVLAMAGGLLFQETIPQRTSGMLLPSLGRLGRVLQNRGFTFLLLLFSLGSISGLAFIASSTYIYQDGFQLSEQMYSFYFALNALGLIAGPMIYLWLSQRFHAENIILACYRHDRRQRAAGLPAGKPAAVGLCPVHPACLGRGSCLRPPATNMMLEQQKGDSGAVSSLIGCTGLLMGSLGLTLISLPWNNMILALGIMTFSTAAVSLIAWPFVITRVTRLPGPNALNLQQPDPT